VRYLKYILHEKSKVCLKFHLNNAISELHMSRKVNSLYHDPSQQCDILNTYVTNRQKSVLRSISTIRYLKYICHEQTNVCLKIHLNNVNMFVVLFLLFFCRPHFAFKLSDALRVLKLRDYETYTNIQGVGLTNNTHLANLKRIISNTQKHLRLNY